MIIHLGRQLPVASSDQPEGDIGSDTTAAQLTLDNPLLFDLALSGVYLADEVTFIAGELLPRHFTLTSN